MSGFLRNLSARALGRSAPVQSAARLPYAALPATFEPPRGDQASSPPAAAPVASAPASPNMTGPTAQSEPGVPHGTPSLLVPSRHDDAGHEPLLAHAMPEPADRDPATSPLTRPAVFEAAEPVAAARVPTPPPLVPTATRFVPPPAFAPAPPASSARMAGAHRHSTSDATEVHVSIGRIELTAVHEAPPPARRAAPVKPSLPLHEYLARRQRRPS